MPRKTLIRYEAPFAAEDGAGVRWRMVEEFDTAGPVVASLQRAGETPE
jgi:hypothetical protein